MQLQVLSTSSSVKKVTVNDQLFAAEVNPMLVAQAIRVYQARARQGTSKTKTRSEIDRTKKKWFKQKGTGNARHGARTPNIFVGGGVSHGPNGLQNWDLELSAQMKRQALIGALSQQAGQTVILDTVAAESEAKALRTLLTTHSGDKKTLVILPETQEGLLRKIRNLGFVLVTTADQVNVYEVAQADAIVLLPETAARLEARLLDATPEPKAEVKVSTKAAATKTKATSEKKSTRTKKASK